MHRLSCCAQGWRVSVWVPVGSGLGDVKPGGRGAANAPQTCTRLQFYPNGLQGPSCSFNELAVSGLAEPSGIPKAWGVIKCITAPPQPTRGVPHTLPDLGVRQTLSRLF